MKSDGDGESCKVPSLLGKRIAYCAQYPYIAHDSVKNNILFGQTLDEEWYETVLDFCCLRPDI